MLKNSAHWCPFIFIKPEFSNLTSKRFIALLHPQNRMNYFQKVDNAFENLSKLLIAAFVGLNNTSLFSKS